ncbi:S-layer protein [Clostridium acetobutylicum]|nr:S-layer protein [Clostridium acetobutylicum]
MKKIKMSSLKLQLLFCITFIMIIAGGGKLKAEQIDNSWTVIDSATYSGTSLNNAINTLIAQGKTKFYISDGVYNLDGSIDLNVPNISIQGQSKDNTKIIQTNTSRNTLEISADGAKISNLNINNQAGGISVSCHNSNNVSVENCEIYGAKNNHALVFVKDGTDDIADVENSKLNINNVIEKNQIYSSYSGDGVFFSKQSYGTLDSNVIIGTRVAFYLSRNSEVGYNVIENSPTNGIRYAVPAYDNKIIGNTIENSTNSGISVARENPSVTPVNYRADDLKIDNNTIIGSRYFGIEASNLKESEIAGNTIDSTDFNGVYVLYSDKLSISQNHINNSNYNLKEGEVDSWNTTYDSGIMMDYMVTNSNVYGNTIINLSNNCPYGIRVQPDPSNTYNNITGNTISGYFNNAISSKLESPFYNVISSDNTISLIPQ